MRSNWSMASMAWPPVWVASPGIGLAVVEFQPAQSAPGLLAAAWPGLVSASCVTTSTPPGIFMAEMAAPYFLGLPWRLQHPWPRQGATTVSCCSLTC